MTCPVTAVFPAHLRTEPALHLLGVLEKCDPRPEEIIVHVDGGNLVLIEAIRCAFPQVLVLSSEECLGPGGSRNRLVAAARHELVANFDDDSFPENPGYFRRVLQTAERFPDAAALSAASQESEWSVPDFLSVACPSGCGCVFRKSWFQRSTGFVPLPIAFNMEEVDIGLQFQALGGIVVQDPKLRVVHEHPPEEAVDSRTRPTVLANTLLLPFLRYPAPLLPLALWHLFSQMRNFLGRGWSSDILPGLCMIPSHLWRHHQYRRPVPAAAVWSWLKLRRHPKSLGSAD